MRRGWLIVLAVLAIAIIAYIVIWYDFGFDIMTNPVDLALTIVWWILVAIVCIGVMVAEQRRQEALNTTFVSSDYLYNIEAGLIKIEDGTPYVVALQRVLNSLKHGMKKSGVTSDAKTRFVCVVRSTKFAKDGDVWEGEVVKFTSPDDFLDFQDKSQLNSILQKVMA